MAEPTPLYPPQPAFRREGLGYVYEPPSSGVCFRIQRLHRESGGVRARITVETTLPGMNPFVYQGRHLLEGAGSMRDCRKALEEITGDRATLTPLWGRWLRELSKAVVDADEQGEPFVTVGDLPRTPPTPATVNILLPAKKPSMIYGFGSAGKGWLATGLAVCVQAGIRFCGLEVVKGNVLYLDWEDDRDTLDRRVKAVAAGFGIEPPVIAYRSCKRGGRLENQLAEVAAFVDAHQITLTVVDSVQMASGSAGDNGTYEDSALRLMNAVACLDTTSLLIDHVNDTGRRAEGLAGKSYGSVFKQNLCRLTWEIKREQETGSAYSHLGLFMTKTNHTAQLPPLGFQLDFSDEGVVRITREDVRDSPTLSTSTSITYRLEHALQHGPSTIAELAKAINAKEDSVGQTLRRHTDKFRQLPQVVGSPHVQWALAGEVPF